MSIESRIAHMGGIISGICAVLIVLHLTLTGGYLDGIHGDLFRCLVPMLPILLLVGFTCRVLRMRVGDLEDGNEQTNGEDEQNDAQIL